MVAVQLGWGVEWDGARVAGVCTRSLTFFWTSVAVCNAQNQRSLPAKRALTYLHEALDVILDTFHGCELRLALFQERLLLSHQLLSPQVQPEEAGFSRNVRCASQYHAHRCRSESSKLRRLSMSWCSSWRTSSVRAASGAICIKSSRECTGMS